MLAVSAFLFTVYVIKNSQPSEKEAKSAITDFLLARLSKSEEADCSLLSLSQNVDTIQAQINSEENQKLKLFVNLSAKEFSHQGDYWLVEASISGSQTCFTESFSKDKKIYQISKNNLRSFGKFRIYKDDIGKWTADNITYINRSFAFREILPEVNDKNASSYFNRAEIRRDYSDREGAVNDYSKALQIDPNYARAYQERGNVRKLLGDEKGANDDFQQAAKLYQKQKNISKE
jgi:tetratricopeptide (TPR) repeat protein